MGPQAACRAEARISPATKFGAWLLPGGVINPDKLGIIPAAVAFVKAFLNAGTPVAAMALGPSKAPIELPAIAALRRGLDLEMAHIATAPSSNPDAPAYGCIECLADVSDIRPRI